MRPRWELTRHYQDFCKDEIHYRVPDGENLHDVAARVRRFSDDHDELMDGSGIHLMVGHRNVNKMILKHVLELSFEEGFRIEQEHQRLYLYFGSKKELWSVWVEAEGTRLTRGYTTTKENGYA
jgi:broad specificity phosphatase PhoE